MLYKTLSVSNEVQEKTYQKYLSDNKKRMQYEREMDSAKQSAALKEERVELTKD